MRDADMVLEAWYAGEVGGEALFWGLAERAEPALARKWLALAEVESRVARRLGETLLARDRAIPECRDAPARARVRCDAVAGKSWEELMRWLQDLAADALREMRTDAAQLPAELFAIGEMVVAHEQALVDFATMEIDGRGEDSLRPVRNFSAAMSV